MDSAADLLERLEVAAGDLGALVRGFDPGAASGPEAARLATVFSRVARLGSAGRLAAAGRVAECAEAWRQGGRYRSAEDWLADVAGSDSREARGELRTGARLKKLPKVAAAVREGQLSPRETEEVALAAERAPGRQEEIIEAGRRSLGEIRNLRKKGETEARSREDDEARARRQHRNRSVWFGTDGEGMGVVNGRLAPERMAEIRVLVEEEADRVFAEARKAGRQESTGAYRADALLALIRRSAAGGGSGAGEGDGGRAGSGLRHRMLIRVDLSALLRGWAEGEETVEIAGCGPVPVATARDLLGEALLTLVVTDGVDIRTVVSAGRNIQSVVDLALRWRDRTCVVPGCDRTSRLERDHWRVDFAARGPTALENLCLLCRFHHSQKTRGNWNLSGGPGRWAWNPVKKPSHATGEPELRDKG